MSGQTSVQDGENLPSLYPWDHNGFDGNYRTEMRRALAASSHNWIKTDDGMIDMMAWESGDYHNGPRCEVCDYGFCEHCTLDEVPEPNCPLIIIQ